MNDAALLRRNARLERTLSTVLSNAPLILFAIDTRGIYTLHEGKGLAALGLMPGQPVGQSIFERPSPWLGAAERIRAALDGKRSTGDLEVGDCTFECTLVPERDTAGVVTGVTGVATDVSAGRTAENVPVDRFRDIRERELGGAVIDESRKLLEEAEKIAHLGSWSAGNGADAPIVWSTECARICGKDVSTPPTAAELLAIVHPADRERVAAANARAFAEGIACETEHRLVLPNGEVRCVYARTILQGAIGCLGSEASAASADGADGEAAASYRIVGVVQDVTERRRTDEARREAELRFRRLFESGIVGVTVTEKSGAILEANDTFLGLLGYSRADVDARRLDWSKLVAPPRLGAPPSSQERAGPGSSGSWDRECIRRDGTTVPVLVGLATLDEERNISIVIDLTERKSAEERRAAVVNTALDAVVVMDASGRITDWNPAAERTFGYPRAEAVGQSLSETIIPQRYRTAHKAGLARYLDTGVGALVGKRIEIEALRRDGSEIPVELSITCVGSGAELSCVGFIRDLSARRQAEDALRRSEEQLRQAQKMEAIGNLAGGVAHDFNNLLTVILSYTAMIVEEMSEADPIRADVEEVHRAGLRATELTRQLLAFGRQQMLQPVVLDPGRVLAGVEKMLGRLLGADVELSFLLAPDAGRIFADAGQLEQVMLNLAVNARDAMPDGGSLTFETSSAVVESDDSTGHAGIPAGDYVLVTVTDTGSGMDRATRERIFDPFFTTKEEGKGTGLGLSTVYGIVKQSDGHIRVDSELGRGTRFSVYFPRTERAAASEPSLPVAPASLRGTETILVVEDEDQVRQILCAVLRKHGYQVVEAPNASEALLLSERLGAPIDLLLSDIVMPRMSGRQLAELLLPSRPNMKVLYVSGYAQGTVRDDGLPGAEGSFLQKPMLPDTLLRKVRQVLDQRALSGSPPRT